MLHTLIDFLFPRPRKTRALETLSPAALVEKARTSPPPPEPWIESMFDYRDQTVRELIWECKFKKNKKAAKLFADLLQERLVADIADRELFFKTRSIIIPIPSPRSRRNKKGFNQTELIANYLTGLPVRKDILARSRSAQPQSRIKNRAERLQNVVGTFHVAKPSAVKNNMFILLDDVTTTGATLREAHKMLLESGAQEVTAVTVAH